MQWLDRSLAPVALTCVYCGEAGEFAHVQSFDYLDRAFALYRCPGCASLHYHPPQVLVRIEYPYSDAYKENTRIGVKYFLEAGYSAELIVSCALAALAGLPKSILAERQFVDIGAGVGLSSLFVRDVCGIPPVVVEPAYMGELGTALLGLDIQRAFFEHLPDEVMTRLKARPCLLHLNSVIEHLTDPSEPLRQALAAVEVETFAAIVPDAAAVDASIPISALLPTLAPGDHLHLPTRAGMEAFMRRLGFAHVDIMQEHSLLVAVGARRPVMLPSAALVAANTDAFLHRLLEHPNHTLAIGAAARLMVREVHNPLSLLRDRLREILAREIDRDTILARLAGDYSWDEVPFHIAPSCYALAGDALERNLMAEAIAWLDVCEQSIQRLSDDKLVYSVRAIDYVWAARLMRARVLQIQRRFAAAGEVLRGIVAARADQRTGPSKAQIAEAETMLRQMRGVPGVLLRLDVTVIRPLLVSWIGVRKALAYAGFYGRWGWYWLEHFGRYAVHYTVHSGAYAAYGVKWVLHMLAVAREWAIYGAIFAGNAARGWLRLLPGRAVVALRRAVAVRRERGVVRTMVAVARKIVRAAENAGNADIHSNGEAFLLRAVLAVRPGAVLDVGARDGPFSALAARLGATRVIAFETDAAEWPVFAERCRKLGTVELRKAWPERLEAAAVLRIAVPEIQTAVLREVPAGIGAIRFGHGEAQAAEGVFLRDIVAQLGALGFTTYHLMPDRLVACGAVPAGMEDFAGRLFVALSTEVVAALRGTVRGV